MTHGTRPVRVLATGFGPFPGVDVNASAQLVEALACSPAVPGIQITTAVLPVVWAEARAVLDITLARHKPHAVIHLGVSQRAPCFEVETRAFNKSGLKADHLGRVRAPIDLLPGGPAVLTATLPPTALLGALSRHGYPAKLSKFAGLYLCNAVLYWSLTFTRHGDPLVGFVHIPAFGVPLQIQPRLALKDAVQGTRILVRAAASAVIRAKHAGKPKGSARGGWNG